MAIEKTITMRQFNGTDYDTLYPETIASQVKGIYNKEETLSSSVAALYGLSGIDAIPNNVFNQLFYSINGTDKVMYQWNRWKYEFNYDNPVKDSTSHFSHYSSTYYVDQYDSITFNKDGSWTGTGRTRLTSDFYSLSLTNGKFYSNNTTNSSVGAMAPLFYASNSSVHRDTTNDELDLQNVAFIKYNIIKTSEIVTSNDPNAYTVSDSPDSEGWYYEKLPDIQLYPPLGRFICSSYVGTGTYGSQNSNTLILPFNPKLIVISANNSLNLGIIVNASNMGTAISGASSNTSLTTTWGNKQVSWYSESASNQLNSNGVTYYYIAFGNL